MEQPLQLEASWRTVLAAEFEKDYLKNLRQFLRSEKDARKIIYPKGADIFRAFELTPIEQVKVVILGQDPYHGPGQACGLCFSVQPGVKPPPSLINIYKEMESDLDVPRVQHGCLDTWAEQGVLLLNSVLTVEKSKAASHQGKGWEVFTDHVIKVLNERPDPIAFVLWGRYAQEKGAIIDETKHLVIRSAHPSPFAANRGFFGSRPFSRINQFLESKGRAPICWALPSEPHVKPKVTENESAVA